MFEAKKDMGETRIEEISKDLAEIDMSRIV